ncbi:MAG TPA: very short patch repair endonuclease [Prolixibacteraceae bacterium]|nr:very short patch repair endonuclease [Prolixibacteraceae bacterium]
MPEYPKNIIKVPRFDEANGFYTTKARSELMKKIKSRDTKPEIQLRKTLWELGLRYRKNVKKLPGSPDIVLSKYKLVIFVDGEFWHGYNWTEKKKKIKANRKFWIPKIERNIQRDKQNTQLLQENGWTVLRFWEFQIKKEFGNCLYTVLEHIEKVEKYPR